MDLWPFFVTRVGMEPVSRWQVVVVTKYHMAKQVELPLDNNIEAVHFHLQEARGVVLVAEFGDRRSRAPQPLRSLCAILPVYLRPTVLKKVQ